jgi:hypothetical protein
MLKSALFIAITAIGVAISAYHPALAEVQVQGRGEAHYETGFFSSRPGPEVRQKALDEAKKAAITRYASNFSTSKYRLFQKILAEVYNRIDQLVIEAVVIAEGADKDTQIYSVIVRASIDDAKLDALLDEHGMTVGRAAASAGGKPTAISFLFVARETSSVKAFEARRTQVTNSRSSVTAGQSQGLLGDAAKYEEATEATTINSAGGSILQKADEITYRITSPEDMNAAMSDVYTSRGFDAYDYRDVVNQCGGVELQRIYSEFANSNELSRDIRNRAFAAARQCEINVFAIGTIDVGLQDRDPVTGNKRVYVSVRSQLLDITGKLPRIIASVGPVQYAGLGPDQTVAMRNALRLAAVEVAKTISDQLNAKGAR